MPSTLRFTFASLLIALLPSSASGRNIDLSTVPKRSSVQLTIYNSEDLTLVRETRNVAFKKGVNPLQFSWANTLIDATSVRLRFLTHPEKLDVADTTFPHEKPQMLYWNVSSDFDGEATIEITYFTSGISWTADYQAIADKNEKQLSLEGFVKVSNQSGEEYEDAEIRLVVGTINLVEKIAQLARVPIAQATRGNLGDNQWFEFKNKAAEELFTDGVAPRPATTPAPVTKPNAIIKEGLSEYFIYTIENTETIRNGWSKRMRSFEGKGSPFKIQYRYRPAEYGSKLVRMYLLANDAESKLGTTPLPDGLIRLFRDNGRGGLSFLASQSLKYIPIGDKIELNLGSDPNVLFELIKLRSTREEIWLRVGGADIFRRVGGGVEVEVNSSVVGWNERAIFTQRIRNSTPKPIEVEVRRSFPGHVTFRSALQPILHDFQTPQFTATIEPGAKRDLLFEIVTRQGRNAKQSNVTLEAGEIKP